MTRKFTWSNHRVLLLRESQESCASWRSLCIDWRSHQELDFDDLPMLFGILVFLILRRIAVCLATTSREEVTSCSVCGWYHFHWWWCAGDCRFEMSLAEAFLDKRPWFLLYFLGIEVARSRKVIILSLRKYVLDMLSELCMLGCRVVNAPIKANVKLLLNQERT